jgi:hypothetical protein
VRHDYLKTRQAASTLFRTTGSSAERSLVR